MSAPLLVPGVMYPGIPSTNPSISSSSSSMVAAAHNSAQPSISSWSARIALEIDHRDDYTKMRMSVRNRSNLSLCTGLLTPAKARSIGTVGEKKMDFDGVAAEGGAVRVVGRAFGRNARR